MHLEKKAALVLIILFALRLLKEAGKKLKIGDSNGL